MPKQFLFFARNNPLGMKNAVLTNFLYTTRKTFFEIYDKNKRSFCFSGV